MRGTNFAALVPTPTDRRHKGAGTERDTLTGLPNRALFATVLREACASTDRDGLALLRVSLGEIAELRADHGLATADALIAAVAGRLQRTIRTGDVAARLRDGDFGLILAAEDVAEAACAAQRVLDRLVEPFEVSGSLLDLRVSIGIAHAPPTPIDPTTLMERAEVALARALAIGGSVFKIFKPRHAIDPELQRALLVDLRDAIARGAVTVSFRPILHVETLCLVRAEAVLRWDHPVVGLIDSTDFLPILGDAEATGLLTAWAFGETCRIVAANGIGCPVVLPVDAAALTPALIAELVALQTPGVGEAGAGKVAIGISEASFRGFDAEALEGLKRLRAAGTPIVLDDYVGHAVPQADIRFLPVDAIRTGPAILQELESDVSAFTRLQALTGLASSLAIPIGAKGVESGEQLEALLRFGFAEVQGALFGEMLTAHELAAHARHEAPFLPRGGGLGSS